MGTKSQLLPHRPGDANPGAFDEWPFMSVHFWGENPRGTWILEIEDADSESTGSAKGKTRIFVYVFV